MLGGVVMHELDGPDGAGMAAGAVGTCSAGGRDFISAAVAAALGGKKEEDGLVGARVCWAEMVAWFVWSEMQTRWRGRQRQPRMQRDA